MAVNGEAECSYQRVNPCGVGDFLCFLSVGLHPRLSMVLPSGQPLQFGSLRLTLMGCQGEGRLARSGHPEIRWVATRPLRGRR
jgi:hypothetical protein